MSKRVPRRAKRKMAHQAKRIRAIQRLEREFNTLADNNRDFAKSLIDQFGRDGGLSEKQWHYVTDVLARPRPGDQG